MMNRRLFLKTVSGSVVAGLASQVYAAPLLLKNPGVVSFSFREQLFKDFTGTLDRIKQMGITEIEFSNLFGKTAEEVRTALNERVMTCPSYGVEHDDLIKKTEKCVSDAQALGAKYIRLAWLKKRQPFTLELATQTANEFNEIGRYMREHGLTFCYHNHGYEFVKHEKGTLFDILMEKTTPEDVSFELDMVWAFIAGVDPTQLLEKYGKRIKLLHVKDLRNGVKTGDLTGKTDPKNIMAAGEGQLDVPAVIKAAVKAGVQHYFIEDESPDSDRQVPRAYQYLKGLKA